VATETEIQFDGWDINRQSGEALRNGRSSRLPQQQLRMLIELHDHAGEIVTRERLVNVLWPKGIVDFDNGLNVAMRKLRVALEDVDEVPRYLETIPKVGYRFIGHRVSSIAKTNPPPPRAGSRLVLGVALAALLIAAAAGWWVGRDSAPGAADIPASRSTQPRHIPVVRAQEFYLEGLRHRSRRDINGNQLARAAFLSALREDPNYPQAWAAYGETLSGAVIRQMVVPATGVEQARKAAMRAIELDPQSAEGHYLLAHIHVDHDKDFAAAKREFDKAFALTDSSARLWHHFAMWHAHQGDVEAALAALRKARALEPATLLYAGTYAMVLYEARRYEQAIAYLQPIVEANPFFSQGHTVLARALMATGNLQGAMEHLQLRREIGSYQSDLGVLYAKLGKRDDALREAARIEARGREGFGVAYELALIHVALGDLDSGCRYLLTAVTDYSLLVNWMRLEPWLDPLRTRQCYAQAEKQLYGPKRTVGKSISGPEDD
jgi:DNA-binding winged helix-turn-helix (wHTH) protein/tetratricopeptide (TPR) repeat protein